MKPKAQRAALIAAIRARFPDANVECSDLPWLTVPQAPAMVGTLKAIYEALRRHRGYTSFATAGWQLACDIIIPSQRLVVEYDERQHFSAPRAVALRLYPKTLPVGFDIAAWIGHCVAIGAIDNDPPYRDEQRAFYDSVRDIAAVANGYRVVRLKHGAFDWRSAEAAEEILKRLSRESETNPRIASICVRGTPKRTSRANNSRLAMLKDIVCDVDKHWGDLDAVVFPGGFLWLSKYVGDLPYARRAQALDDADLVTPIKRAAAALTRSPGALIVFGVDGPHRTRDGGDQLCVAANADGIVGIGRKIFPVAGEEAKSLLCYDGGFADEHRVVNLPNGRRAVLCACYDMFGVADPTKRRNDIRRIGTYREEVWYREEGFAERLSRNLESFKRLLDGVSVGIAAIHRFPSDGSHFQRTQMWQRHGVAGCSAALKKGFAVGAAHFANLPRNPNSSTLAAKRVPTAHLTKGNHRTGRSWPPKQRLDFEIKRGRPSVLLAAQAAGFGRASSICDLGRQTFLPIA